MLLVELEGTRRSRRATRVEAVVSWSDRFPTMANHTATHLLHAALRDVLGDHVNRPARRCVPTSSASTSPTSRPLTPEERERVERIVNEKVFAAMPVRTFQTPIDEAR